MSNHLSAYICWEHNVDNIDDEIFIYFEKFHVSGQVEETLNAIRGKTNQTQKN